MEMKKNIKPAANHGFDILVFQAQKARPNTMNGNKYEILGGSRQENKKTSERKHKWPGGMPRSG